MQIYKLVLIGDKNTGKTAYITRHTTGFFENKYVATLGAEVHPLTFKTNHGIYQFNVWDTAGNEKFGGLRDGYFIDSDACIAFYTKNSNHQQTDKLVDRFLELNPNAKLVIVWNKSDLPEECEYFIGDFIDDDDIQEKQKHRSYIKRHRGENIHVYQISGKSLYNQEKPFLYLLQQLTNKQDLIFT